MRKLSAILILCALHAGAQTNEFGYPVAPDASSADTGIPVTPSVTFDVTATGGAAFSYPIEAPKGLPGMQPSFAITYNSQTGNGIAGYGCNISGISVISVVPKDRFHDGTARGCRWDGTDGYTLDGARLILKSGTYGAAGSVYCTENNPFIHITMQRNYAGSYQNTWFEVADQDGNTYTYGQTDDSRQDFIGHDNTMKTNAWYVNHVQNNVGNYMTYSYIHDSLFVYPSVISYGMNTSDSSLVNRIRFEYGNRYLGYEPFVLDGAKGAMCKLLNFIFTETGNSRRMMYVLNYGSDNYGAAKTYHRLTSVKAYDEGYAQQKPTELTWNTLPQDQNVAETLDLNLPYEHHILHFLSSPHFFTGDINGDGVSDIIEHVLVSYGTTPHNYFYLHNSNVSIQGTYYNNPLLIDLPGDFTVNWGSDKSLSPMTIDYDGDGLDDIIIPRILNSQSTYFYYYIIYGKDLSNGNTESIMHVIHTLSNSSQAPLYNSTDFNKDGISDIFVMEQSGVSNSYNCCFFEGAENHNDLNYSIYNLSLPNPPKQLFVSDYNGDGMTDLLVTYSGGYKIFWNRLGFDTSLFSNSYTYSGTTVTDGFRVIDGDFDGDGLTDFMVNSNGGTGWNEYRNQGDGSFMLHTTHTVPAYLTCNSDNDKNNFRVIAADLNGDGRSDVFVSKAMYGNNGRFIKTYSYWLMSKSGDLLIQKYSATSVKESDASPGYYTIGDFHGLGRMELMNYGYDCLNGNNANVSPQIHVYPVSGRTAATGNLASIKDALQRTSSFSYKSMTDPTVYTKGTSSYPVLSCTLPLSAVSSVTSDLGAAGQHTTQYTYQDLKVHTAGRGLIGMKKVVSSDAIQGVTTEQVVDSCDQSLFVPTATHTKTTTASDGKYTQQVASSTLSSNGGAYCVSSVSQTTTDFDGLVTQKSVTYDTYTHGKVMSETTTSEQHSKGASYHYALSGGIYLPDEITFTQKHADDALTYSYTNTYTYNSLGLLTTQISFSDKSRPQTTGYTYDAYGNVTSKSISGVNGETLPTEHYEYDATHRFMAHRYSSSQLPSYYYTYDRWGRMTAEDVVRGNVTNTTTYSYNTAGLQTSAIRPDGSRSTFTYGWGSTSAKRYYVLRQGTAEPWVKTWYDNCGREVLTESVGQMGITVKKRTTYNNKGLISDTNDEEGIRHLQRFLTYDPQGRLISEIPTAGQGTSYSYDKLKTVTTENGLTTTKIFDPWGNLKSSQQGNVTVSYSYNSQGLPVSVSSSADNGNVMTMQYDDMGCRTQLTDADAGTITYGYDGLNRMVSRTDARGKTTTTTYNTLGQKASEVVGSSTTTYTYYTSGSGIGQLESSTLGTRSLSYEYDNIGRVCTETRQSGSTPYTYTYQYNQQGLLSSKTYPQNLVEEFEYDAYGFMSSQEVAGQTVWERTSATGAVDQYALGGGLLIRRNTYDDLGQLTETRTGLSSGSTPLYQMSFVYNANSDLTQRTLLGQGTETFTYDSYDRLSTAGNSGNMQTFNYYANGNVHSKTGIGQYYYDETQPHAVSGVDNTEGLIPLTTQRISVTDNGKYRFLLNENSLLGIFYYGPNGERWRSTLYGKDYYYLGDVERIAGDSIQPETLFYYLSNDVLYVKKAGVSDSIYYLCRDNLGSIMRIMDANGREVFNATYDAWGRQTVNRNDIRFFRGFTGHEMINEAGLINMNGRVYDPLIGRFLSPDDYVQLPENPQNLNRYSYCLNNPLKYTDPSGELFGIDDFLLIVAGGALVGGVLNVASNCNNIKSIGDFFGYFGVGALAGGVDAALSTVSFGVGGFIGGALTGLTRGAAFGFILGGGNSILQNGNFSHFWGDAFSMATLGAISGAMVGGVMGGISARSEGKTFWTGQDRMFSLDINPIEPVSFESNYTVESQSLNYTEVQNNVTYELNINTNHGDHVIASMDSNVSSFSRPQIKGYNPKLDTKTDIYHVFPKDFDSKIVNHGIMKYYGNSSAFVAPGCVNSHPGMYTIMMNNQTGIIYHRFFYGVEKIHTFKLNGIPFFSFP